MEKRKRIVEECQAISVFGLSRVKAELKDLGWDSGFSLSYSFKGKPVNLHIKLTTTSCNFGGERYWLVCPLCGNKAGKLFRPPEEKYFGCRSCYDLTYRSVREHDQRVDAIVKNPNLVRTDNPSNIMLSLKAFQKLEKRLYRFATV